MTDKTELEKNVVENGDDVVNEIVNEETNVETVEDIEEPGKEVKDDNFRLANKWLLLTYKTHIPKDDYIKWIKKKHEDIDWIRLAHESADEKAPYIHTHVVLMSGLKIFKTTSCRFFDYKNIHPHIRKLTCPKAFNDAKIYIAKEDKQNEELKTQKYESVSIVKGIMSCKNDIEALELYCQKPSDAPGIMQIRGLKTFDFRKEPKIVPPKHKWQFDLLEMTKDKANRRDVIWIMDKKGNSGKSELGDFIEDTMGTNWSVINKVDQTKDLAEILLNELMKGWDCHGLVYDLTASAAHCNGFYDGIECIKNGRITSTKWKGNKIKFDIPHVVVFANFLPRVHQMKLDRWKIFEITKEMELRKIDAYKIAHTEDEGYGTTLGIVGTSEYSRSIECTGGSSSNESTGGSECSRNSKRKIKYTKHEPIETNTEEEGRE